ncbi:hypothetical protein [Streptomyces lydicus]|uniref:hypothetical protein n=1 Tax=Streptomyces lydicus TaxID=47763 RepID=UPI0018FE0D8C|nr:hypothetical protein [Streptomyces lydicus]MDC7340708.1 hypothetical protein [Streptomyces lydicus]
MAAFCVSRRCWHSPPTAHRIPYDTPYRRNEEGYPGLVAHRPLPALLTMAREGAK